MHCRQYLQHERRERERERERGRKRVRREGCKYYSLKEPLAINFIYQAIVENSHDLMNPQPSNPTSKAINNKQINRNNCILVIKKLQQYASISFSSKL